MRIGIDMDGVVYPFVQVFLDYCKLPYSKPKRWDFNLDLGMSNEDFLKHYKNGVDANVIFRRGDTLPGAVEALQKLKNLGHTIHLVTDRFVGERAHINTALWLQDHPTVIYDSLTFAKDKAVVNTRMFLDDKPDNVNKLRMAGCHAWLLDTGLAEQARHPYLISGWDAFLEEVILFSKKMKAWGEE